MIIINMLSPIVIADTYVYFVWSLLWLVVWGVFFSLRTESRREMLITSLVFAPLGPIVMYFHIVDYFHPVTLFSSPWSIENWLFGFTTGGIAAVLYEQVCTKGRLDYTRGGSMTALAVAMPLGVGWMSTSMFVLSINSLYASVILFLVVGLSMLFLRPRLIPNAVISGALFALFLWLFYEVFRLVYPELFTTLWVAEGLSGLTLFGVPVEEVLWGFGVGFMLGPASELAAQLRLPKMR